MKHALFRSLAVLALLAGTMPAFPQEAAGPDAGDSAAAERQDIERMIQTLEDPEARAELVRELKVLLEAERAAGEPDLGLPTGGDLLETLQEVVTETWDAIVSVDPLQLLISVGLSVAIILGALALRWVIVELLQRLYLRLTTGGEASAEEVIEIAGIGVEAGEQEAEAEAEATGTGRHGDLPPGVFRLINLILGVLTVALIAETWGAGVGELLRTDLGARIAQAALSIGVILVVTLVAWHVAGLVVARLLTLAGGRDKERAARRLGTLVPLLRSVLQGIIGVLAALLILSELGVNIAPLLAGAGIVGIAVGFGAQTLVKDLLTGVTILTEDAATVGDVVEVGGHTGVVEEMRVRLMRLRDVAGAVHLIPYSEVTSIVNFTRDFSYYLMDIGVAYRENTDEVCEVLRAIGEELRRDRAYRYDILEALDILGVNEFADSAVVIRARIKTRPGRQWVVGREFNRRMKHRFDELNIEIPFPHTTVYFGEPKAGSAPPVRLAITEAPEGQGAEALASPQRSG